MSLTRWGTRRDQSEPAIRKALGRVGARFLLLDPFDLLVLFRGKVYLLECKTGKGKSTRCQDLLVQDGWPVIFVTTPEQALKAIGAME